jgi:hypothetical protein
LNWRIIQARDSVAQQRHARVASFRDSILGGTKKKNAQHMSCATAVKALKDVLRKESCTLGAHISLAVLGCDGSRLADGGSDQVC